jgi:hypothetical protein
MGCSIKVLIDGNRRDAAQRHFAALGQSLGADVAEIALPPDCAVGDSFLSELLRTQALVSSAETLIALFKKYPSGLPSLPYLLEHLRFLLIYGLERCSSESSRLLFGSDVIGVTSASARPGSHRYCLPGGGADISGQLAGLSFDAEASNDTSVGLGEGVCGSLLLGDSGTRLIDRDDMPLLAALRRGDCEVFLLASSDLLDVNEPAVTGELPRQLYPALLPWLLFIRRAAGQRCWHNPAPQACLIIDDPLLRPRYGFLSFAALVESMRRSHFKTTIAFIPWNYARSRPTTTALLRENAAMLTLCVHGCDHTTAEFGSTHPDDLRQKAGTALERMRGHERTSRINWDRVMVFPQGVFSGASLLALEKEGYLAAVNTRISSVDCPGINRLANLLAPASKAYGGVPLFKRHHPGDLLPFALDLFLGKQVLIVGHHTYFRSGYDEVATFVAQLKAIEPRLTWSTLGDTVCRTVQYRKTASGNELRAYTDKVVVRRTVHQPEHYKLIKYETDPASVSTVRVNGRETEYRITDDRVEVELQTQSDCRVDIVRRPPLPFKGRVPSFSYGARVAARRYLSELRDDSLAGNSRFLPTVIARRIIGARH